MTNTLSNYRILNNLDQHDARNLPELQRIISELYEDRMSEDQYSELEGLVTDWWNNNL